MAKKRSSKHSPPPGSELRELESHEPGKIREQVVAMLQGDPEDPARARIEVRKILISAFANPDFPLSARIEIGNILAKIGDPRFDSQFFHLPKDGQRGFIHVDAGEFVMGSDPSLDGHAYENEEPRHTVTLPEYFIARWPVTVAQFRAFVQDSGHHLENEDSLGGMSNHPVGWVYWGDALAYCNWLTDKLRASHSTPQALWDRLNIGWRVTLPSEAEWEKAARGTTGRIYPWGNEFDPTMANTAETDIGIPTPVGCFWAGRSPFDVEDVSGNVWEWTRTQWDDNYAYPYPAGESDRAERENLAAASAPHVVRGGSFSDVSWNARCARRHGRNVYDRYANYGFRVALSLPAG
ncbi:MAG: SUMF1/EgtB/PvdO family nonheme iron enzyme [Chloroflexi bacterium]|nr:SUMF1/EgtB/PvdO family nonheme iron enzyme [Chloroflexota bacterium]